ncbi:MAG: bifunctional aspartate kinase/homoserine dehydrogenase I [Chlamydiota bacterium]
MKVLKFGGSSVADAERIESLSKIIINEHERNAQIAVVVSALKGVTDTLINMGTTASTGSDVYLSDLETLHDRHNKVAKKLISQKDLFDLLTIIESYFNDLSDTLHGVRLVKELSDRTLDLIMSYGEQLSATIIAAFLRLKLPDIEYLDARKIIVTNRAFGSASIDEEVTYQKIRNYFNEQNKLPVITGFIAATSAQETTTLGRGGSDFTASIVGAAMNADAIEIWTDVDGVMTADPRKVPKAFAVPQMSYQELMEMSHFGAEVVYPPTIAPAMRYKIPIWIKNTFRPNVDGTKVTVEVNNQKNMLVRGISSVDNVSLLRLEGNGMIGIPGVASRLFGALARNQISVMIITQASSEHSICFGILPEYYKLARDVVDQEFSLERSAGLIDPVVVDNDVSMIAVVGENMSEMPGVSGRFFGALGRNGVNVIAIAQGSSEFNITCLINKKDESKALNVIHDEFFLSNVATINLFLIGTGLIGQALIKQIKLQVEYLRNDFNLEVKVCGLADRKTMLFDSDGIDLSCWREGLSNSTQSMEVNEFIRQMNEANLGRSIFVDCTASDLVASKYAEVINSSISVVTPNKRANSSSYQEYKQLNKLARLRGVDFYYETNVGAGLPIISTIHDLLLSGDKIHRIEAVLSGTLSYIFNEFQQGIPFHTIVQKAQKLGYTEPDPREDLNGMDVARKILILARECGHALELEDVTVEALLPQAVFDAESIDQFFSLLGEHSKGLNDRRDQVVKQGKALRYIASFVDGVASIKLEDVDALHPFYSLSGSDNIVAIYSSRYNDQPLVIKGAGAGADVTAGGVFADVIKIGKR